MQEKRGQVKSKIIRNTRSQPNIYKPTRNYIMTGKKDSVKACSVNASYLDTPLNNTDSFCHDLDNKIFFNLIKNQIKRGYHGGNQNQNIKCDGCRPLL